MAPPTSRAPGNETDISPVKGSARRGTHGASVPLHGLQEAADDDKTASTRGHLVDSRRSSSARPFASARSSSELSSYARRGGSAATGYAVVFPGAFATSASRRAEIASNTASLACSIDAMA